MLYIKRAQLSIINFQRTYLLSEAYERIKERAIQVLAKYPGYPDLITFKDLDRSVTFPTERLIPTLSGTYHLTVIIIPQNASNISERGRGGMPHTEILQIRGFKTHWESVC